MNKTIKKIVATLLSLSILIPTGVSYASAAGSEYSNNFESASLSDFDTTAAMALVKDGSLLLKQSEGDAGVMLKDRKYKNFTVEVDITVVNRNDGAPSILYRTQDASAPYSTSYSIVFYPNLVKGCFFAPYADNGWMRGFDLYEDTANATFRAKLAVCKDGVAVYANDTYIGAMTYGDDYEDGLIGLGSYRSEVKFDNLKISPLADDYTLFSQLSEGSSLLSEGFDSLSSSWSTPSESTVFTAADGMLKVKAPSTKNDQFIVNEKTITSKVFSVETTFNVTKGNAGLAIFGGADDQNGYQGYSFTYDFDNRLVKASRYYDGYLAGVESLRHGLAGGDHQMKVCVDNGKYTVFVDGAFMLEFNDKTFDSGKIGYLGWHSNATFDNLKVVEKGSAPAPTTKAPTEAATTTTAAETTTTKSTTVSTTETETQTSATDADDIVLTRPSGMPGFVIPLIILGVLVVAGGAVFVVFYLKNKKNAENHTKE